MLPRTLRPPPSLWEVEALALLAAFPLAKTALSRFARPRQYMRLKPLFQRDGATCGQALCKGQGSSARIYFSIRKSCLSAMQSRPQPRTEPAQRTQMRTKRPFSQRGFPPAHGSAVSQGGVPPKSRLATGSPEPRLTGGKSARSNVRCFAACSGGTPVARQRDLVGNQQDRAVEGELPAAKALVEQEATAADSSPREHREALHADKSFVCAVAANGTYVPSSCESMTLLLSEAVGLPSFPRPKTRRV